MSHLMSHAMSLPIKTLLGHSLFAMGLHVLLLRSTATIVAFHRVLGHESDAISVDVATFERYCRYFKRHFNVIALRDLIYRFEHGGHLDRHLAITFDDGYLDNFENALPVLERLGLPATFFIVSGWIGSDVVPWWDQKHGAHYDWMTWEHVRQLHRRGFEIGVHTRNHVDLGQTSAADAWPEIYGAREDIENEIGAPVESFAYPYGGERQMNDGNLSLVRAAGFRCCCSAHGGLNPAGADPFRLRRVPISPWYGSPQEFGLEVVLRRTLAHAFQPSIAGEGAVLGAAQRR
jgi:peptidoglycan/xylan/chitin deacetylase (PgdA/CDA1 family)